MSRTRRNVLLVWLAIVSLAITSACTFSKPPGSAQGKGSGKSSLQTIRDRGELVVGTSLQFKPEVWADPNTKEPKGFWVSMARQMAQDLGVKVRFVDSDFNGLIPGLQAGKYDIVLAQMAINSKRALSVQFSKPWEVIGQVLITRQDSSCASMDCLNQPGKRVVDEVGSVSQGVWKQRFSESTEVSVTSHNDGFLQVQGGKADAFISDNITAKLYEDQHPGVVKVTNDGVTQPFLAQTPAAAAFPNGDAVFVHWVDIWLTEQISNGTYERLYKQDIGISPALPALQALRGSY